MPTKEIWQALEQSLIKGLPMKLNVEHSQSSLRYYH